MYVIRRTAKKRELKDQLSLFFCMSGLFAPCHARAFSAIIIQMFFTFMIILVYKQG